MMKQFLLPALAVAILAGSAKAEDPSTETAWVCASPTLGRAEYVINGNELKKRDDDLERYEACRRNPPAPASGPVGKIGAEALHTDPCEPPDLESYTFKIELNNSAVLIAVSPAAGRDNTLNWVAKRMVILDKLTGHYVETLLSTPPLPRSPEAKQQSDAHIAGTEYGGTCDMKAFGNPNSVSSVSDASQNLDPVVEDEERRQNKSDMRNAHVRVHRRKHHYKHVHRHDHHLKLTSRSHYIRRAEKTQPDRP